MTMSPAEDEPPDQPLSEIEAQLARVVAENAALRAENKQLRARRIEHQVADAQADELLPLKLAAGLAGVDEEHARRLHHRGKIVSEQPGGKGTAISATVESLNRFSRTCGKYLRR